MSMIQRSATGAPASPSRRRQRRRAGASAALATLLLVLLPSPASAVTTVANLGTALCGGAEVKVTADITEPSNVLTVADNCTATLDLNGKELTLQRVVLGDDSELTIKDSQGGGHLIADATDASDEAGIRTTGATLKIESGSVTATGGNRGAGVGGRFEGSGGTVTISGGTVIATGVLAAGIGGGWLGSGGTVTISGGEVIAAGGDQGAGIGGGRTGASGTTMITGGEVTAIGGNTNPGAGIGGGWLGGGGTVAISGGAVTATAGGSGAAPIGVGFGGTPLVTVTVAPSAIDSTVGFVRSISFPAQPEPPVEMPTPALALRVACGPEVPSVGTTITCTVTGGDPGIVILWRASYNPAFAGEGVTLDASGSGEFSFVVPAAAVGRELTVELVEWLAPVSLGVVGGPVPGSVPAGDGPVPVWPILLTALVGFGLLRRGMRAQA